MSSQRATTEVDVLLMRLGLDKYKDTLASHGLYTMEDLRQAKGTLISALPLGPKARLLREINESETDVSVPQAAKEYAMLISILKPYIDSLGLLTSKLHEVGRRNPTGAAGRQHIIATTTLKVCEKAVRDSQRFILLSRKHSAQYNADLTSCRVSVGSCVRQLRQQQQQGIMKALDDADLVCALPTLDFSSLTIGMISSKLKSPQKRPHSATHPSSYPLRGLDASIIKELRQLRAPPQLIIRTVSVMLNLIGSYSETTWAGAKERLGSAVFLTELANFDEKEVPNSVLSQIGDFITDPDSTPDDIKAASSTAGVVAQWIHKVYTSCMMDRNSSTLPADHHRSPSPPAATNTGRGYMGGSGDNHNHSYEAQSPSVLSKTDMSNRPETSWNHSNKCPTDYNRIPQGTHVQSENALSSRENFIRLEELRLQKESDRLVELEKSLLLREQRCREHENNSNQLSKTNAEPIIKQLDILKGLIMPGGHSEDPQITQKVNQIYRAAATSRALLAHLFDACSEIKKKQQEEMEVIKSVKIGSQVQVTKWLPCEVISHHRGRIDVELKDGSKIDALPINIKRDQDADESENLSDKYPKGTAVSVGGKLGTVIGTFRGRVGVEFPDGATSGVIPQKAIILTENEALQAKYPLGLEVVIMEDGIITGSSRGRLGVTMKSDGSQRGVVPPQLKPLEGHLDSIYPTGQQVIIKSTNELATVTGVSRGRIGIQKPNGSIIGVVPHEIVRTDSNNEEVFGYNNLFQIGSHVRVMSLRGEVCHHSRGRLGVILDKDGTTVGVLPCNVRVAELSDSELKEKFSHNTVVKVANRLGRVTYCSRGRIGVQFEDGVVKGVIPTNITIPTEDQQIKHLYPVGLEVVIMEDGIITGSSRGRLGVTMKSDGSQRGVVPPQLKPLEGHLDSIYPTGQQVIIKSTNELATVTGVSRGRIGIQKPNGSIVGVVPHEIVRTDSNNEEVFGYNNLFQIGSHVRVMSLRGEVCHHSRGRLGVILDKDGKTVGVLPCNVRVAELSDGEMKEKFIPGTPVLVGGQYGRVTHCARGRIGVELKSGETRGVLPTKITILTETQALSRDFTIGTSVQLRRQFSGVVIGSSRGRFGVILENGSKIGCLPSELSPLQIPTTEQFPVGSTVDVKMRGRITGHNRGRIGVEFPNGVRVGVMPEMLSKCDSPSVCI